MAVARPDAVTPAARRWLALAAVLAVVSLGLPWTAAGTVGAAAPARALVVGAGVLAVVGLRTRAPAALTAALAVGVSGVLLGGLQVTPGRLVLAAAVSSLALGLRGARPALLRRG
ncbi:hypothetical protein GB931_19495 [Modestobacter sp. I12A-02628]|uniref:Uncharacterized protein n=1 Tax=Goekera deserti TaxID=2497753 RepID=A0A7K3WFE2_9ACTN|nr:hypothetical protein [Goekera deserti]MPR00064.1 hypothetical protein [Goekera deserti]NDI49843.1 hypothetical protein [Goekera deserti]NEL55205.1 hypothetical protein [Goekera deserti]